jgi:hypothetical protein
MKKITSAGRSAALAHLLKASFLLLALVAAVLNVSLAYAQGPQGKVGVCHKTGSATNPWVYQEIDGNAWPAHEKNGDVRASSPAQCEALSHSEVNAPGANSGVNASGANAPVGLPATGGEPPQTDTSSALVIAFGGLGLLVLSKLIGRRTA